MIYPGAGIFFLVPLVAVFANSIAALKNLCRAHPVNRVLLAIYLILIGINSCTVGMLTAADALSAMRWLFTLRHFLFFFPTALLLLAAILSGRSTRHALILISFGAASMAIVAADATFFSGSTALVLGMRQYTFGFFPELSGRALAMLGVLFLGAFSVSIYWLLRPLRRLQFFSYPMLILLYALWWPGIMLNAIPLSGTGLYPLGSAVDAVVSLIVTAYLHRNETTGDSLWQRLILPAILVTVSMLVAGAGGLLMLQSLGMWAALPVGLLMSLATLLAYRSVQRPLAEKPALSLESITLSKQERRICELIHEGYARSDILIFLNIADGTLRNHLQKIYAKTIDANGRITSDEKDKLQRLTVYLNRLKA